MKKALALLPLAAVLAAPAHAAKGPSITVSPATVVVGDSLTVTGQHWPVIEFCSRDVRFSLRSATHPRFHLGNATVTKRGRFTFTYKVKRRIVKPGAWRLRANMMCESGKDGSPRPIKVTVHITVVN